MDCGAVEAGRRIACEFGNLRHNPPFFFALRSFGGLWENA